MKEEIYFIIPGEIVVYRGGSYDGHIAQVMGIKHGRITIELLSSNNMILKADPQDLIDSAADGDEDDDSVDGDWDDQMMDMYLQNLSSPQTPCVEHSPSIESILLESTNKDWKFHVSQGQNLKLQSNHGDSLQMLLLSKLNAGNDKEYSVSVLLAGESAHRLENFEAMSELYDDYFSHHPADVSSRLQYCHALFRYVDKYQYAKSRLEMEVQKLATAFPTSPSVLFFKAKYYLFCGDKASFQDSLKECCSDCPLLTVVEYDSYAAIDMYTQIGKLALEMIDIDPWLSVRAFIRSINIAKNVGFDPFNPILTPTANCQRDNRLKHLVAESLFEFAVALKLVDGYFRRRMTPNCCFLSSLYILQICCELDKSNAKYQQSKDQWSCSFDMS